MTDPFGGKPIPPTEATELSQEELERRIGGAEEKRAVKVRAPRGARARPTTVSTEVRRRILWRDSATILIGVLLALLAVRVLFGGSEPVATASPTPPPSGVAIGSTAPTLPGFTAVPTISDPLGSGVIGTPTPIPLITLGPATPRPSKTPGASLKPGQSPPPPTAPVGSPTIPPAPVAGFSCQQSGLTLTCIDASTDATGWTWDWGDGRSSTGQAPGPFTYLTNPGIVPVMLTVTGPGGSDAQTIYYDFTQVP